MSPGKTTGCTSTASTILVLREETQLYSLNVLFSIVYQPEPGSRRTKSFCSYPTAFRTKEKVFAQSIVTICVKPPFYAEEIVPARFLLREWR
jgi:hypothetical protein